MENKLEGEKAALALTRIMDTKNDPKPGDRVGVILSADRKVANFLGWGTFTGNVVKPGVHIPTFEEVMADPEYPKPEGATEEELRKAHEDFVNGPLGTLLYKHPRIELEDGREISGSEVWWAKEAETKAFLATRTVINVDIDAARRAAQRFNEKGKR